VDDEGEVTKLMGVIPLDKITFLTGTIELVVVSLKETTQLNSFVVTELVKTNSILSVVEVSIIIPLHYLTN
jgi:hypothetical protein